MEEEAISKPGSANPMKISTDSIPKLATDAIPKLLTNASDLESRKSKSIIINPIDFEDHEGISENRKLKQPPSMRSKTSVKDKELPRQSTFVTGVPNVTSEAAASMKEVQSAYTDLNSRIDKLNEDMMWMIRKHENEFLGVYKDQMYQIQRELANLKQKVSEEALKRKADQRMLLLEQERDWFRNEAIRLDRVAKEQHETINDLRFKLKLAAKENVHYEEYIMNIKKENRGLKQDLEALAMQVSRLESNEPSIDRKEMQQMLDNNNQHLLINDNFQTDNTRESTKFLTTIQQLQHDLEREKRMKKHIQTKKVATSAEKTQLQQILADCILDMKKEIHKRRLRNLRVVQPDIKLDDDIDISKLSSADKKKLVEKFVSNDEVLLNLYKVVFNQMLPNTFISTNATIDNRTNSPKSVNGPKVDLKSRFSFTYGFQDVHLPKMSKVATEAAISTKAQVLFARIAQNGQSDDDF